MTSTSRLETFSDGVFAIAITLLVLGIHVPARDAALGPALLDQWPVFLAYLVSFLTIGIMWINHHKLFEVIGQSTTTFAFINVVFLMVIAFVPYPTEVLAERLGNGVDVQLATVFYGATMTLIAGALQRAVALRRAAAAATSCGPISTRASTAPPPAATSSGRSSTSPSRRPRSLSPLVAVALFLAYAVYWVLPTSAPSAGVTPPDPGRWRLLPVLR